MAKCHRDQEADPTLASLITAVYVYNGTYSKNGYRANQSCDVFCCQSHLSLPSCSGRIFPYCRLITVRIFPVMPDKTRIYTVHDRAVITALRRTFGPVYVECSPRIHHEVTPAVTKCSPDRIQILSGLEESFRVFQKGN